MRVAAPGQMAIKRPNKASPGSFNMRLGRQVGRLAPQWPWEPDRAGLQLGVVAWRLGPRHFPGEGRSFGLNDHKPAEQSISELIGRAIGAANWLPRPLLIAGAR